MLEHPAQFFTSANYSLSEKNSVSCFEIHIAISNTFFKFKLVLLFRLLLDFTGCTETDVSETSTKTEICDLSLLTIPNFCNTQDKVVCFEDHKLQHIFNSPIPHMVICVSKLE